MSNRCFHVSFEIAVESIYHEADESDVGKVSTTTIICLKESDERLVRSGEQEQA